MMEMMLWLKPSQMYHAPGIQVEKRENSYSWQFGGRGTAVKPSCQLRC